MRGARQAPAPRDSLNFRRTSLLSRNEFESGTFTVVLHATSSFTYVSVIYGANFSFNKILFQSKAIFLHFGEGPRKIKVKKHARMHTPKAAKLSTCSPQQAGIRNYSSVELSFLYRGITSNKKTTKPEISSFCSRNLDDQQQSLRTTTRKLRRCRTRTDWLSTSLTSSTLHYCPSFSSLCS